MNDVKWMSNSMEWRVNCVAGNLEVKELIAFLFDLIWSIVVLELAGQTLCVSLSPCPL